MNDLISRQAAIDAVIKRDANCGIDSAEVLKLLPSAEPERMKGKWINGKCSACGEHAPFYAMASTYYGSKFCPNCGADMRGEQEGGLNKDV